MSNAPFPPDRWNPHTVLLVAGGHPRVTAADFTGDGLLDLVIDRAWGLVDLNNVSQKREFGALLENVGTATSPKWQKTGTDGGAPFTERFQTCDAVRQNVVRAVDWNNDGKKGLVFSDQDNPGFYFFENVHSDADPRFAPARHLELSPYKRPNLGSLVDWDHHRQAVLDHDDLRGRRRGLESGRRP